MAPSLAAPAPSASQQQVGLGGRRTPPPEPSAEVHYERVRWFVVERPGYHRQHPDRSSHVPLRA